MFLNDLCVIPAKAGIQPGPYFSWIPAFAGMTKLKATEKIIRPLNYLCKNTLKAGIQKLILLLSSLFLLLIPTLSFGASPQSNALQYIAQKVNAISHQLVDQQGQNQQNWNKLFEIQVNQQYSPSDYPAWHNMQSQLNSLQIGTQSASVANLASSDLYNPALTAQASNLDVTSTKVAGRVINQAAHSDSTLENLVNIPLSQSWHQGLTGANEVQVLKALSAQVAVGNALKYKQLQATHKTQLLLARVLVELTQLNQHMVKLQKKG